jgi:hypothetical protein
MSRNTNTKAAATTPNHMAEIRVRPLEGAADLSTGVSSVGAFPGTGCFRAGSQWSRRHTF